MNIEKPIVSGTQFTATSNSDDRQLCCPPTDTSPPFTATEEGLNTNIGERPTLRFENGNLVFDQLVIQNNGSNTQDADYTSGAVNRKIDIKTPSFINAKFSLDKNNTLVELNKGIKKIELIENMYVQELNKEYVDLKIKYLGKINKIIQQLRENNIILKLVGDQWILKIIS